jgi:hypothetical protein
VVRSGFQLLTGAAAVTVFAALMFWLDWGLALIVLVGVIAIRRVQNRLVGRVSHLSEMVNRANEALAASKRA